MCGGADSEDFLLPTYDMMMAVRACTPQNSTVFLFKMFLGKGDAAQTQPGHTVRLHPLVLPHLALSPISRIKLNVFNSDKKIDQFFWRGSDSNHLRFDFNRRVASLPPPAGKGGGFWNVGISHMIRSVALALVVVCNL